MIGDHSEVIRVEFDPAVVSYKQLLDVFWESHDPEYHSLNRQYRNATFYLTEVQRHEATSTLKAIEDTARNTVFTVIEPAGEFYVAEDYHQKYLLHKARGILHELQAIYPESQQLIASTAAARINGYLGCNGELEALAKELPDLGLSRQMQELMVEHVTSSCDQFSGLTCPAPKSSP